MEGSTSYSLVSRLISSGDNLDMDVSLIWNRVEKPLADSFGVTPEQDDF